MTLKQKLNQKIGSVLRKVNPQWVEKTRDIRDYKRSHHFGEGLDWNLCDYSEPRYASSAAQVGSRIYVIGGYYDGMNVLPSIEVFDMESEKWTEKFSLPSDCAESHMATTADGEFIYLISGQKGGRLSPSTRICYSLHLKTRKWNRLPDLPEGRYAAAAAYYNGRVHVVGGAKEDRRTGTSDHLSLGVEGGAGMDGVWRKEVPIPKPGVHRGNQMINGEDWYLMGGQESETPPKPGDPEYSFIPGLTIEAAFADVFRYSFKSGAWETLAPLPHAVSHTDASVLVVNGKLVVLGGQLDQGSFSQLKIPVTDIIQEFDPETGVWSEAGYLPFRIKLVVSGYHNGKVYMGTGQKDTNADDAAAERYIGSIWNARYPW